MSAATQTAFAPWLRCPDCLNLIEALEWKCAVSCKKKQETAPIAFDMDASVRFIATKREQSFPCPHSGCGQILSQPFAKQCDRPYRGQVRADAPQAHHVVVLPLDSDQQSLVNAIAAYTLANSLHAGGKPRPLDEHSRTLLNNADLFSLPRFGHGDSGRPIATHLDRHGADIFVRGYSLSGRKEGTGSVSRVVTVGDCKHAPHKQTLSHRLLASDVVVLAFRSQNALENQAREIISRNSAALAEAVYSARDDDTNHRPALHLALTDQEFFEKLLGVRRLPGLEVADERVMEGYVLDGLRMREIAAPILESNAWSRVSSVSFSCPLRAADSVKGLWPWLRQFGGG